MTYDAWEHQQGTTGDAIYIGTGPDSPVTDRFHPTVCRVDVTATGRAGSAGEPQNPLPVLPPTPKPLMPDGTTPIVTPRLDRSGGLG